MKFTTYSNNFANEARDNNKSEEYIQKCLAYAEKLNEKALPIIYDVEHFSRLVGIDSSFIYKISNNSRAFYRFFSIPKKDGGKRKISEPLPMLKKIQEYILVNILYKLECNECSKAYRKQCSLRDNAKFHRNQKIVLKMDIKDYFNNIKQREVYNFFNSIGYTEKVSLLLSRLCTLDESLPQGAPTSPYLSNLVTTSLDDDIYIYCRNYGDGLRYTRYADDITISGDFDPKNVISNIRHIVRKHDLKINDKKNIVVTQNKQQRVTGIVVNKKLQAKKEYRRCIRQEVYYIKKYGLQAHLKKKKISKDEVIYMQSLLGRVNYCLQINKADKEMREYKDWLVETYFKKNK